MVNSPATLCGCIPLLEFQIFLSAVAIFARVVETLLNNQPISALLVFIIAFHSLIIYAIVKREVGILRIILWGNIILTVCITIAIMFISMYHANFISSGIDIDEKSNFTAIHRGVYFEDVDENEHEVNRFTHGVAVGVIVQLLHLVDVFVFVFEVVLLYRTIQCIRQKKAVAEGRAHAAFVNPV